MDYAKKNLVFILVALLALLLIVFVIWLFDKRIKTISERSEIYAAKSFNRGRTSEITDSFILKT